MAASDVADQATYDEPRPGTCTGCHQSKPDVASRYGPPAFGRFLCGSCYKDKDEDQGHSPTAVPAGPEVTGTSGAADDSEKEGDALLADVARGALTPVAVKLPNVPVDATDAVRRVVADFELFSGSRLAVMDTRPVPYSCRWAARRLGLSHMTVYRILQALEAREALKHVGNLPSRAKGQKGTNLYAPAPRVVPAPAVRHLRIVA